MLKFFFYLFIFYYCIKLLIRFLAPFLFKSMVSKLQKNMNKKHNKTEFKKHNEGDTEVSYKKDKNIDPGGEYVDFEDLNDE